MATQIEWGIKINSPFPLFEGQDLGRGQSMQLLQNWSFVIVGCYLATPTTIWVEQSGHPIIFDVPHHKDTPISPSKICILWGCVDGQTRTVLSSPPTLGCFQHFRRIVKNKKYEMICIFRNGLHCKSKQKYTHHWTFFLFRFWLEKKMCYFFASSSSMIQPAIILSLHSQKSQVRLYLKPSLWIWSIFTPKLNRSSATFSINASGPHR